MTSYPLTAGSWDRREAAALQRVIKSGQFTMGGEVRRFEQRFAKAVGSRHAVMVNSGSSANLLAIAAMLYRRRGPWRRGDEVIVPALSWSTTYFPVHQHGLRLVFVDIDPTTPNLEPARLEAARSPRTRAVFVPNILGNPADLRAIQDFCSRHGLDFIEDNCESLGASLDGRQAGTFGLMGTFSTFYSHHISTMEGGVVVTDDEELRDILVCLRAHGWTRQLGAGNKVARKGRDPFAESFRFVLPGYNVRPLELSGAVGVEQLRKLPAILRQRRANARVFRELFGDDARFQPQVEHGRSSWFGFALTVRGSGRNARRGMLAALRKAGVEVRPVVAGNFLRNDVIARLDHRVVGAMPGADAVHDRGFFLGNHPYDLGKELRVAHRALASAGR